MQEQAKAPCNCEDYNYNIKMINDMITYHAMRNHTNGYNGKLIEYCPWCGSRLEVINDIHENPELLEGE